MKLEYFGVHGRAMPIRMLLNYCNVEFEDSMVDFPTFGKNKAEGKYPMGQVPVLWTDDGRELCQTKAILRYLSKEHKGRKGEVLYPAHSDPMVSYKIDAMIDSVEDVSNTTINFLFAQLPGYKNKDEHFTQFILNHFPKFLASLE